MKILYFAFLIGPLRCSENDSDEIWAFYDENYISRIIDDDNEDCPTLRADIAESCSAMPPNNCGNKKTNSHEHRKCGPDLSLIPPRHAPAHTHLYPIANPKFCSGSIARNYRMLDIDDCDDIFNLRCIECWKIVDFNEIIRFIKKEISGHEIHVATGDYQTNYSLGNSLYSTSSSGSSHFTSSPNEPFSHFTPFAASTKEQAVGKHRLLGKLISFIPSDLLLFSLQFGIEDLTRLRQYCEQSLRQNTMAKLPSDALIKKIDEVLKNWRMANMGGSIFEISRYDSMRRRVYLCKKSHELSLRAKGYETTKRLANFLIHLYKREKDVTPLARTFIYSMIIVMINGCSQSILGHSITNQKADKDYKSAASIFTLKKSINTLILNLTESINDLRKDSMRMYIYESIVLNCGNGIHWESPNGIRTCDKSLMELKLIDEIFNNGENIESLFKVYTFSSTIPNPLLDRILLILSSTTANGNSSYAQRTPDSSSIAQASGASSDPSFRTILNFKKLISEILEKFQDQNASLMDTMNLYEKIRTCSALDLNVIHNDLGFNIIPSDLDSSTSNISPDQLDGVGFDDAKPAGTNTGIATPINAKGEILSIIEGFIKNYLGNREISEVIEEVSPLELINKERIWWFVTKFARRNMNDRISLLFYNLLKRTPFFSQKSAIISSMFLNKIISPEYHPCFLVSFSIFKSPVFSEYITGYALYLITLLETISTEDMLPAGRKDASHLEKMDVLHIEGKSAAEESLLSNAHIEGKSVAEESLLSNAPAGNPSPSSYPGNPSSSSYAGNPSSFYILTRDNRSNRNNSTSEDNGDDAMFSTLLSNNVLDKRLAAAELLSYLETYVDCFRHLRESIKEINKKFRAGLIECALYGLHSYLCDLLQEKLRSLEEQLSSKERLYDDGQRRFYDRLKIAMDDAIQCTDAFPKFPANSVIPEITINLLRSISHTRDYWVNRRIDNALVSIIRNEIKGNGKSVQELHHCILLLNDASTISSGAASSITPCHLIPAADKYVFNLFPRLCCHASSHGIDNAGRHQRNSIGTLESTLGGAYRANALFNSLWESQYAHFSVIEKTVRFMIQGKFPLLKSYRKYFDENSAYGPLLVLSYFNQIIFTVFHKKPVKFISKNLSQPEINEIKSFVSDQVTKISTEFLTGSLNFIVGAGAVITIKKPLADFVALLDDVKAYLSGYLMVDGMPIVNGIVIAMPQSIGSVGQVGNQPIPASCADEDAGALQKRIDKEKSKENRRLFKKAIFLFAKCIASINRNLFKENRKIFLNSSRASDENLRVFITALTMSAMDSVLQVLYKITTIYLINEGRDSPPSENEMLQIFDELFPINEVAPVSYFLQGPIQYY